MPNFAINPALVLVQTGELKLKLLPESVGKEKRNDEPAWPDLYGKLNYFLPDC